MWPSMRKPVMRILFQNASCSYRTRYIVKCAFPDSFVLVMPNTTDGVELLGILKGQHECRTSPRHSHAHLVRQMVCGLCGVLLGV